MPGEARRDRLAWIALFLAALLLRLACIGHGAPHHEYVPDNHIVRASLGMLAERDPFPPPGRYSTYPNLLPYLLAPLYAGTYLYLRASGAVESEAAFGRYALEKPFAFFAIARALIALFGALSAAWAYLLARRLGARPFESLAAGILVASGLLHLQLSVQARPWVPVAFFVLLACERAACALRGGPARAGLACALAAGAAAACHPAGFVAFLPLLPVAWAAARRSPGRLLGIAAAALGMCAVGYPALWLGIPHETAGTFAQAPLRLGGQGLFLRFDFSRAGAMARSLALYEPALWAFLALALAGGIGVRGARASSAPALRAARWVVLFPALLVALSFLAYFGSYPRYFLPALVLLPAWAAAHLRPQRWSRIAVAALLVLSGASAVRMALLLDREDTRNQALAAIASEGGEDGRRFAVEAHGPPLALSRAALERLRRADPGGLHRRERHRLESGPRGGLDALPLERLFSDGSLREWRRGYAIHLQSRGVPDPGAVVSDPAHSRLATTLACEGITDVLRVRRDSSEGSALLDQLLERRGRLVGVFAPGSADALLPSELGLGVLTVWTARSPGPRIEWYQLR